MCSSPTSFHGDCSKKIVKAHTVPKSSSLKAIAEDGHVYGLRYSLESIRKFNGRLEPELIGINNASTFNGFCKIHYDSIFSPIEKGVFTGTQEQCFLLAYRSLSRECYTKSAMNSMADFRARMDQGKSIDTQMVI